MPGRARLWSRESGRGFDMDMSIARAEVNGGQDGFGGFHGEGQNSIAERYRNVPYNSPIAGASYKVEPDTKDGVTVHALALVTDSNKAWLGASCSFNKALNKGSLPVASMALEAWVNKSGAIVVRQPNLTSDKSKIADTHIVSGAEYQRIVADLKKGDESAVNNF